MELKFSIQQIKLLASHFELNPSFIVKDGQTIEILTNISVEYSKQKGKIVAVKLSVTSDGKEQPFTFSTVFVGLFSFSKMPEKQNLDRIANVNCAAILLPYVRESIADLTRRAGIPPYHMNPVNFVAGYKSRQELEEKKGIKHKGE